MALRYVDSKEPWNGEAILGYKHPLNIESMWTDVELLLKGLERVPVNTETTVDDIVRERERRMQLGFDYDFGEGDPRGVHQIGTTDADMKGWNDVIILANALIDTGDTATTIEIWTDTGHCTVTAPEWQAIILYHADLKQFLWKRSFELMAMQPIPDNYADDALWTP